MSLTKQWKEVGDQVYSDVAGGKENPSLVFILMIIRIRTMTMMVVMMVTTMMITMLMIMTRMVVRKVMMMMDMAIYEVTDWDDDGGCLGLIERQPT